MTAKSAIGLKGLKRAWHRLSLHHAQITPLFLGDWIFSLHVRDMYDITQMDNTENSLASDQGCLESTLYCIISKEQA